VAGVAGKVGPQTLTIRGVRQVVRGRLQHAVLELVFLVERDDTERGHAQQGRDVGLGLQAVLPRPFHQPAHLFAQHG